MFVNVVKMLHIINFDRGHVAKNFKDGVEKELYTVDSEIFTRIFFPRIALKDIFATLKNRD